MLKTKSVDTLDAPSQSLTNVKKYSHSLNTGPRNPAYQYYLQIRGELPKWWEQFSTQRDPVKEGWRYRTARSFAKAKTEDRREQEWIEGMIGPVPLTFAKSAERKGKLLYLKLPWLGDWEARRTPSEPPAQIRALAQAVREKLVAWDAIRACAPLLIRELAIYDRMTEQIDEAFGGQAFDPERGPTDPKNRARFYTYLTMRKRVTKIDLRLLGYWMLVHGINPKDPLQLT